MEEKEKTEQAFPHRESQESRYILDKVSKVIEVLEEQQKHGVTK